MRCKIYRSLSLMATGNGDPPEWYMVSGCSTDENGFKGNSRLLMRMYSGYGFVAMKMCRVCANENLSFTCHGFKCPLSF